MTVVPPSYMYCVLGLPEQNPRVWQWATQLALRNVGYIPEIGVAYIPRIHMSANTKGAHLAPIASPYRTQTACGIILHSVNFERKI